MYLIPLNCKVVNFMCILPQFFQNLFVTFLKRQNYRGEKKKTSRYQGLGKADYKGEQGNLGVWGEGDDGTVDSLTVVVIF